MSRMKDLYLGKSIDDLDNHAEIPAVGSRSLKILLNTAQKLFKDAEKYCREGDEEMAYVFYMKYFNLLDYIHKKPDYVTQKVLVKQMLGDNTKQRLTMDKLEDLKSSLMRRYKLENEISRRLEAGSQYDAASNKSHISSSTASIHNENFGNLNTISCSELYDRKKEGNVLILDCRTSADYALSHLNYSWTLNIPEEIIVAGMSAGKLQDKLEQESKALWAARSVKDYVVLMDWNSKDADVPKNAPIAILRDILQNWDPDITYRSPIKILEGGYEFFIMLYPTMCTNPSVKAPNQNNNQNDLLDEIEYPSISDITMKDEIARATSHPRPFIDRSSKMNAVKTYEEKDKPIKEILKEEEELIEKAEENDVKLEQAKEEWLKKFDAKQKPATDDMSSDQRELLYRIMELESLAEDYKMGYNRLHDEFENYKRSIHEEKLKLTPQEVENVVEKSKIIDAKIKERQMLDAQHERDKRERELLLSIAREQKRKMILKKKQEKQEKQEQELNSKDYDYDRDSDNEERTRVQKNGPVINDITSISSSTQSLNAIDQNEPKMSRLPKIIPSFDRSMKPTEFAVNQNTPAPQNIKKVKERDFSPIYGGQGPGLTGLKNLGNTCYMNSIVQCLSNTPQLTEYCLTDNYKNYINHNNRTRGEIVEELASLIKVLWNGNCKYIAPRDLRQKISQFHNMFRGYDQQDSHEFLTILMDSLHSDLQSLNVPVKSSQNLSASERAWLEFTKARESLILHLFYGQIKSTVKCVSCEKESATYESFSNLSLELPSTSNVCYLSECMDMYFSGELIHGWNCPNCKMKRSAIKKLDISKLPPVLVIHLKRFYADHELPGNNYKKKQNFLRFPLENLNMEPYIAKSKLRSSHQRTYDLFGVSNHYGSMEGGHYTAFCKNGNHDRWFKFDDHVVSPMEASSVVSSAAYILFYTWLPPIKTNDRSLN